MSSDDELNAVAAEARVQLKIGGWVDESRALAEDAYGPPVNSDLRFSRARSRFTHSPPPRVTLSDEYKEMSRAVARTRAVEAGARTAGVLSNLFD